MLGLHGVLVQCGHSNSVSRLCLCRLTGSTADASPANKVIQSSQRVHRADFGGLELEGRVAASRAPPGQPPLPDAPTLFGR